MTKRKKKPTAVESPPSAPSMAFDDIARTESLIVETPPPRSPPTRASADPRAEERLKEGLMMVKGKETVKVMVRVRPFMPHEIQKSLQKGYSLEPVVDMTDKQCSVLDEHGKVKDIYKFDRCFWSMPPDQKEGPHFADQATVFDAMGKPSVAHAFVGYNACIFAYGQTGSGKTHSMLGTETDPGLAPRIIDKIFTTISEIQRRGEKTKFEVRICFMEIYNEKVMDLLADDPGKTKKGRTSPRNDKYRECKVRYSADKGTYVDGITRVLVTSSLECLRLMHSGMAYRATAAHAMNDQSSRSHAIFQICLKQNTVLGTTLVSLVNIVDLAGSERVKMTQATGTVLDEAKNINLSLTTLRRVIDTLLSNAKKRTKDVPPYREAMLTWVLKDSLGGNSKTMMIAAISPHRSNIDDTQNTLKYALKAKAIVLHAHVNEEKTATLLKTMKAEIEALQRQLREGGGEVSEAVLESHRKEFEEALRQAENAAEQAKQAAAEDKAYMQGQIDGEKKKKFAAAFRNAFAITRAKDETNNIIAKLKEELVEEKKKRRELEDSLEVQLENFKDQTREQRIRIQSQEKILSDAKVYTQELRVGAHKLDMKNGELTDEVRYLRDMLKKEQGATKSARETIRGLQEKVAELQGKVRESATEAGSEREALHALQGQLRKMEMDQEELTQQNKNLKKTLAAHEADRKKVEEAYKTTILGLREKVEELEGSIDSKHYLILSLRREIHELKDDVGVLHKRGRPEDGGGVAVKGGEGRVDRTMVHQATDLEEKEDENRRLREALDRHDEASMSRSRSRSRSPSVGARGGECYVTPVRAWEEDRMHTDFKEYMTSSFFPSNPRLATSSIPAPPFPQPGAHEWTTSGGVLYGPRTPRQRSPSPTLARSSSRSHSRPKRSPTSSLPIYCGGSHLMNPTSIMLLLGVLQAVEGWTPVGPWQKPSSRCMQDYGQRLVGNQNVYKKGCRDSVPEGLVEENVLSVDACVQWCFDYYFGNPPVAPMPPKDKPLLNYTTLFNASSGDCYCTEDVVQPSHGSQNCPIIITQLPTGCMFEQEQPCDDAPADGCLWLNDCCIDPAGFDWPGFRNLVPWWAWGVGAMLLLLSSLLGLIIRARNRFGYATVGGQVDEIDRESIGRLKGEYEELLKELAESDRKFLEREGMKKRKPRHGEPPTPCSDTDEEAPEDQPLLASPCINNTEQHSSTPPDDSDLLSSFNSDAQGGTCPVCLEDLISVPCVRLKCGHRLRLACMQEYVNHSVTRGKIPACPICRAKILTPSREEGVDI